jgi:NAD(P)-dependent dehydrogenase (short-subunit alcohol dehydrogenase family)
MKDLEGKVAFITGGASGIGLGMAKAFLKRGMKVAIADIHSKRLVKAEKELDSPGKLIALELDVTDRAAIVEANPRHQSERHLPRCSGISPTDSQAR